MLDLTELVDSLSSRMADMAGFLGNDHSQQQRDSADYSAEMARLKRQNQVIMDNHNMLTAMLAANSTLQKTSSQKSAMSITQQNDGQQLPVLAKA